jgi:hypothetical protein
VSDSRVSLSATTTSIFFSTSFLPFNASKIDGVPMSDFFLVTTTECFTVSTGGFDTTEESTFSFAALVATIGVDIVLKIFSITTSKTDQSWSSTFFFE